MSRRRRKEINRKKDVKLANEIIQLYVKAMPGGLPCLLLAKEQMYRMIAKRYPKVTA